MRDEIVGSSFCISSERLVIGKHSTNVFRLDYIPEAYHAGLYDYHTVYKPATLSIWEPRRQAQFLAGRLASKEALGALHHVDNLLPIGKQREPIWPTGLTGSISHSKQTSIAAIKQKLNSKSGLGIDIQRVIDLETQEKISPIIVSNNEKHLIHSSIGALSESLLFSLVFSAKESFFKAVFNTIRQHFDFDVVTVINIDERAGELTLKVMNTLGGKLPEQFQVIVSFTILDTTPPQVITVCNWEL